MNKAFYQNCIVEDRNTRQFLDFSEEQWFKDFNQLHDNQLLESKGLGENASWRNSIEPNNAEYRSYCMQMKWNKII